MDFGGPPCPLSPYFLEGVPPPRPGLRDLRPRNSQPLALTQPGARATLVLPERMSGAFIHQSYVYVPLPGSGMGTSQPRLEGERGWHQTWGPVRTQWGG